MKEDFFDIIMCKNIKFNDHAPILNVEGQRERIEQFEFFARTFRRALKNMNIQVAGDGVLWLIRAPKFLKQCLYL